MAPSTDQFSHYISGKGSAASWMLIVVNAALVSAMLLLACAFCKKYRTKEVNLIKNRKERPKSELKKVIVYKNNEIRQTNVIQNGAVAAELREEEDNMTVSVRLQNGAVLGCVKSVPDRSPPLLHRVLPLPPENRQAAPSAPESEDPLYDTVKEMKEQLVETYQHDAQGDKEDSATISKTINTITPENQGPLKLERINPIYVPADQVKGSRFYRETMSDLHSRETDDEKDDDGNTWLVTEPVYAVIRKEPTLKKPPPQNPGEDRSQVKDSALQKVVLPLELNSVNKTVHFITPMEKSLYPQSPGEKVDSMLTYWKKKSVKSTEPAKEDMSATVSQEVPPLVPVKRFDVESEIEQHTIEEEKA